MKFFKKRINAWIVTILVIVLSTIISGGSSLNNLRKQTIDIFYMGEDRDGTGIQHDLDMIMSDCSNLTVVSSRYMDKDHDLIKAVLNDRNTLNEADTPSEKYDAARRLLSSATALYTYLGDLSLSEKDQNFRNSLYANINSHNIIISRSTYNQYARDFNSVLSTFPANILSKVAFVPPVELYE